MNIMTIIELDNEEIEKLIDASLILVDETVYENLVHACVEGFICNKTNQHIDIDDAMERVFLMLKANRVIPSDVTDFSYEVYSCERIKHSNPDKEQLPNTISISFTQTR